MREHQNNVLFKGRGFSVLYFVNKNTLYIYASLVNNYSLDQPLKIKLFWFFLFIYLNISADKCYRRSMV